MPATFYPDSFKVPTQNPVGGPEVTGSDFAGILNNLLEAVLNSHSSASRPDYAVAGTIWRSSVNNKAYYYNGFTDIELTTISSNSLFGSLTDPFLVGEFSDNFSSEPNNPVIGASLPGTSVSLSGIGNVYQQSGGGSIVVGNWLQIKDNIWRLEADYSRSTNTSNPSSDSIEVVVRFFNASKQPLATNHEKIIRTDNLLVSAGWVQSSVTMGNSQDLFTDIQAPVGAVYATYFIRVQGNSGVSRVRLLKAAPITLTDLIQYVDWAAATILQTAGDAVITHAMSGSWKLYENLTVAMGDAENLPGTTFAVYETYPGTLSFYQNVSGNAVLLSTIEGSGSLDSILAQAQDAADQASSSALAASVARGATELLEAEAEGHAATAESFAAATRNSNFLYRGSFSGTTITITPLETFAAYEEGMSFTFQLRVDASVSPGDALALKVGSLLPIELSWWTDAGDWEDVYVVNLERNVTYKAYYSNEIINGRFFLSRVRRFATDSTAITGTNINELMHPANTRAAFNSWIVSKLDEDREHDYEGEAPTVARNGRLTFTHGLGAEPRRIEVCLVCTTATIGYSVGDAIMLGNNQDSRSGDGTTVMKNATQIHVAWWYMHAAHKTILNDFYEITYSAWKIRVRAWK